MADEQKTPEGVIPEEMWKKFEEYKAKYEREHKVTFPISVTAIRIEDTSPIVKKAPLGSGEAGQMVAIRSCKKEHGETTRLGILVGHVPIMTDVRFVREEGKEDTGVIVFKNISYNPAIFVPELNEVILGCESWWGPIKDEAHLKQITNEDIQNVWYVKALKQLSEAKGKIPS